MKTVGIIGGGAAGLIAAKHILETEDLKPIVWEQTGDIGGTWAYTPETGEDKYGLPIHSSMYSNLRTNLAKEVMGYTDFPFPQQPESFISHSEVLKYLHSFADHFSLRQYIKTNHHVELVSPQESTNGQKWKVAAKDLERNEISETICDFIIVCNGHYSVPQFPDIPGIDKFKGFQIHSHKYRHAEDFKGRRVVLLGGGVSGIDISLELSKHAKEVILSHTRVPLQPIEKPDNWRQSKGIVSALEDGFILSDGEKIYVDAIMFCTGYKYTFPFLAPECGISVENRIVHNLYKHMINTAAPSMAFIGIPTLVCPFLLFDFQAGYITQSFLKKIQIPSKEKMDQTIKEELMTKRENGVQDKYFHKLGPGQWKYFDELCEESKMAKVQPAIPALFNKIHSIRNIKLLTYRKINYSITGPDSFLICNSAEE